MLKLTIPITIKPLYIIFQNCLKSGILPDDQKKGNFVPVFKKTVNNQSIIIAQCHCYLYVQKFLRSPYSIVFIVFIIHNKLLNNRQSSFRPNYSCINQLISVTHKNYCVFEANPSLEVRGIFLDLSKAFDKVQHVGLLYKLKSNGNALQLIKSFLHNRSQRVVVNGQSSSGYQQELP